MIEQEYEKNTRSLAKLFQIRNEYTVLLEYYEVKVNLDLLFCNAVRVIVHCVVLWFADFMSTLFLRSSTGNEFRSLRQRHTLYFLNKKSSCIIW